MQFPAWVLNNPVTYFGFYGAAGGPSVEVADTLTATSVSPTSVTGSDTIVTLTSPPITRKVPYAFAPGSMAGWGYQTWVDPYDPLGSIVGPEGETYAFQSVEIYQPPYAIGPYAAGVTATAIAFHGPDASGQVVYQSDTGLILGEDVVYSNHSISQNFHSISSAPTPPAASLVWRNADGDTELWNPNGTGGFVGEDLGVVGASWRIAATGNVNGNGESILWRNANGDTVLWKANRSGGFTDEDLGVVDASWQIAGTGDFNGYGEGILWRANGDTALWNPNGSGGFTFEDLGVVGSNWQIAGTGDFNRNAESSILWRNPMATRHCGIPTVRARSPFKIWALSTTASRPLEPATSPGTVKPAFCGATPTATRHCGIPMAPAASPLKIWASSAQVGRSSGQGITAATENPGFSGGTAMAIRRCGIRTARVASPSRIWASSGRVGLCRKLGLSSVGEDLDADVDKFFVRVERDPNRAGSVVDDRRDLERLEQLRLTEVLDHVEPGGRDPSRGGDAGHGDVELRGLVDLAVRRQSGRRGRPHRSSRRAPHRRSCQSLRASSQIEAPGTRRMRGLYGAGPNPHRRLRHARPVPGLLGVKTSFEKRRMTLGYREVRIARASELAHSNSASPGFMPLWARGPER
jgi:hypothetical protein